SFRPRLAASVISPLRFAMTSPPSGCQRDFHPQAVEHARHTKNGARRNRALLNSFGALRLTSVLNGWPRFASAGWTLTWVFCKEHLLPTDRSRKLARSTADSPPDESGRAQRGPESACHPIRQPRVTAGFAPRAHHAAQ